MFSKLKLKLKNYIVFYKNRKKCTFNNSCNIGFYSIFEGSNVIGLNSIFSGKIGYGSYIGENSVITGNIGKYSSIAGEVVIINGVHPTNNFVSTHPVFYSTIKQNGKSYVDSNLFEEFSYADKINKIPVVIGNDVWIGYRVTIIAGVTIGDGSIVLAGSIVTKDVLPYSIVGGIPAKHIKYRFSDSIVDFLKAFEWWKKDESWIKENVALFSNIENFENKFGIKNK